MLQEVVSQKSELEVLLEKNAHTKKGLTLEEDKRARELIEHPEYSWENCWVCEITRNEDLSQPIYPTIYDTGMCIGHVRYALYRRK